MHHLLYESYFHSYVGAEGLQGSSKMARAKKRRMVVLIMRRVITSLDPLITEATVPALREERLGIVFEVLDLIGCRRFGSRRPPKQCYHG